MEFSLVMLLVIAVEIAAIVDALRGALETSKKVTWVILIFVVPVLGAVLYYLLGRPENRYT